MFTLGYSFRPWKDAQGDRRRAVDPQLRARHRARARRRRADPLPPPGRARRVVERRRALDGGGRARRHGRDRARSRATSCSCAAATTATTRATRRSSRASSASAGQIVHPQHWPDDVDYAGKRVVVIGSGATAVTLVPAMAERAAHVTMLQRSPSYIVSLPGEDPIANVAAARAAGQARLLDRALEERPASRWSVFELSRRRPRIVKALIRKGVRAQPSARLRHRHPLQARATTRGTSACAWCPTATCSRR